MLDRFRRRTLFRRLLLVLIAALTLVYAGLGVWLYYDNYEKKNGSLDKDLILTSSAFARLASVQSDPIRMRATTEQILQLIIESGQPPLIAAKDVAYQIWSRDGQLVVASSESPSMPKVAPNPKTIKQRVRHPNWTAMASPSPDGKFIAVVGYSKAFIASMNRSIINDIFKQYLTSLVLLAVALWLAVRFGLRPLRELAALVGGRAHDDFSPFVGAHEYAEISPLVTALNDKMSRIGTMIEAERDFFTDAAHELRTPLAALSAQAHLVAIEQDPGRRAEALVELEAGMDRSAQVLNRLLSMAKYHSGQYRAALSEIDLVPLVSKLIAGYVPRAIESKHELELVASEHVLCLCDANAIRIAIDNILDNALRYSPDGGRIIVSIEEESEGIFIAIADEGPGVAVSNRSKIFERFERLDTTVNTGSGLGLAIVKRIVELHNGTIVVTGGINNRGTRFEIGLPQDFFDRTVPATS